MPKDGGYLLPEVVDPQRIRLCIEIPDDLNHIIAFWGALQELGHPYNWRNDEAHTALAAAAVWRDVYYKARDSFAAGECASEETCQTYAPTSPRLTWSPVSPYNPNPEVPPGYLFAPWTVVTTSIIDQIISQFGLGYKVGDVYTDITKLPPGDWGEIIDDGYLFFPRLRVNDLNGAGTVKIHFLNIPQGGRALIVVDGVLDLLNLQLIELNKDGVSLPPETQVPIVIEVPIETVGEHYVDVVFVPNVNDEFIPFFFGGGIRQIEICGFGLEGCDDVTDPCCPETNATLLEILNLLKGGATINFNTQALPSDFTVDCTPDGNSGNAGEDVPTQIMRQNALCLALARWLVSILGNRAEKMNQSAKLPDIWALGGFLGAPKMYGSIQYVEFDMTVSQLNAILESDTAFNQYLCILLNELAGEDNTFTIFKKQFEDAHALVLVDPDTVMPYISFAAMKYSTSRVNYTLFSKELERAFEDLQGGLVYDCNCFSGACDVNDFVIVSENGAICTSVDADTWHIEQSAFVVDGGDVQRFEVVIREQGWRCFNHVSSATGQSSYEKYNCAGVYSSGTGGGGGLLVWHKMYISFPSGSHIVAPLAFDINIACP